MEEITQSFTITLKTFPGTDKPAQLSYKPDGPGIQPDDCILLCARGVEWAVEQRQRVMMAVAHQASLKEKQDEVGALPGMASNGILYVPTGGKIGKA